jgi:hypothetical protein
MFRYGHTHTVDIEETNMWFFLRYLGHEVSFLLCGYVICLKTDLLIFVVVGCMRFFVNRHFEIILTDV